MEAAKRDVLCYYSAYYQPGMVDLSSSSALTRGLPLPGGWEQGITEDELQYVPPRGGEALREAIARRYETIEPDEVVLCSGASEAVAALALALVRPGDAVCVDRGTYPSFLEAARAASGRVYAGLMRTGTKVVARCNPTTPDGSILDVREIAQKARACGAVAVFDEVYRDFGHNGAQITAAADLDERAVSVSGLSKALGMGGLRIGWIATHDRELLELLDRRVQLLSGGPASLSVRVALAAIEQYDERIACTLREVSENAPRVLAELHRAGWSFCPPEAGLTVEARPPAPVTCAAEERLRDAGYFLVPCDVYGTPGTYRISLLAGPLDLRRALALLGEPETHDGGPLRARHRRVYRSSVRI